MKHLFRNMSFKTPHRQGQPAPAHGVSRERSRAQSAKASVHSAKASVHRTWQERQLEVTDPKAMRALAHPVRIELLRLLREPRTATECADAIGESPQSC